MFESLDLVTLVGVVSLGLIHGAEPGHGWPIAATYALDSTRKWTMGLIAGLVIGVGHLISSLAVVAVFFLAKSYFDITQLWWLNEAAGVLLILLGIHEYRNGHSHSHGEAGHSHGTDSHSHGTDSHSHGENGHDNSEKGHRHDHDSDGDPHEQSQDGDSTVRGVRVQPDEIPIGIRTGGSGEATGPAHGYDEGDSDGHAHGHSHTHGADLEAAADEGLWGLASAAFVLGFAHEEEFEIIGICAGTDACLSLMVSYALAVILSLVGLTLLLVAGYQRYQDRVERIAPHFSTISAVVLVAMGLLFIAGIL